jgi:hypothetical protein
MKTTEFPSSEASRAADEAAAVAPGINIWAAMYDTRAEMVDGIIGIERMIAGLQSARAQLIDQARKWSELTYAATESTDPVAWDASTIARKEYESELACALHIPERTAQSLIGESKMLVNDLPATLEALRQGEISYRHSQKLLGQAASIPGEARETFEAEVLPFAKKLTVPRFDSRARKAREKLHPESIRTRHQTAIADRNIQYFSEQDGMASILAFLPAAEALAIDQRLTDAATALQGPSEPRTLTQLRADLFAAWMLTGFDPAAAPGSAPVASGDKAEASDSSGDPAASEPAVPEPSVSDPIAALRGITPTVVVTVPVLTLMGKSAEPAQLEGYGPIDADTARILAAGATSFIRLLTDPEKGTVLSVSRKRYRVPSDLRTWLRVRDGTCRFPGCGRRAKNCDADHTDDWQLGGETSYDNLAMLCPKHHKLKHNTAWKMEQLGGGVIRWTSPDGKIYDTDPETDLPGTA